MGHKFASSNSDEFTENARLVLFQFDVAMESCDVYESVGGSEGFPSSISVVVVGFVFVAVPSPSRTDKVRYLKIVPRGTLVRGYPVHSNVERHGVHPPSPSTSKGVFAFDAGAIERNVVAHNESVCIWTKGDEMDR